MLVGVLILAGAQNTSIVGANGVLNRVAEDGVLTSWFQRPHDRYGTSYRIINLIVGMQLVVIFLSLGNVYVLAALYAFGVIWSFAKSGTASRNSSTNSASMGIRNWAAAPWASGLATFWLRCVILAIFITCGTFWATPTPSSRMSWS